MITLMQFIGFHRLFRIYGYMNNLEIAKQAAIETGEFLKKKFLSKSEIDP